jgi:hypothetical protein
MAERNSVRGSLGRTGAKRKTSKKPSAETPNTSSTGKRKATPKQRGGGKKQGR